MHVLVKKKREQMQSLVGWSRLDTNSHQRNAIVYKSSSSSMSYILYSGQWCPNSRRTKRIRLVFTRHILDGCRLLAITNHLMLDWLKLKKTCLYIGLVSSHGSFVHSPRCSPFFFSQCKMSCIVLMHQKRME